jgi:hypothetical protein
MRHILITLCFIIFTTTANAGLIYEVNRTIGTGTVTGFVETDGTIGVLASSNITDWTLTLTAPNLSVGSPDVISFATQAQTYLNGNVTTATATDLLFDFSGNGFFLLQGGDGNYWCLETSGCTGDGLGEHMGYGISSTVAQTAIHSGSTVFASVNSVPEPTTLAIFCLGLLGLRFKRSKA